MKQNNLRGILTAVFMLLAGLALYALACRWDNKYTAALPGGNGYNVWQQETQGVAFLVDGWEYYPGQLLEPADFAAGVQAGTHTWIGEYPNFAAQTGSPYGTATYRLLLYHEGEPETMSLYLPELLCAGRVYINGVLMAETGCIEPYRPHVLDSLCTFTAGPVTEIVVQCANYTHYYSGMYYPPGVGSPTAIGRMLVARLAVYGVLCFGALALALSYLGQWAAGRDAAARWLGLLSLAFAVRTGYPFWRAAGAAPVRALYALEDLATGGVLLFAVLLAGELTGTARRGWFRGGVLPVAAALCTASVVFPLFILPFVPAYINLYGLILFGGKLAAGLCLLALALGNIRPLCGGLAAATGLYGASVAAAVLGANRFEPIYGAWPNEYGGFALVAGFAVLMAFRSMRLAAENRRLTEDLQSEVARKTQAMERLLEERRDLLARLVHDVKNPLAALRGYAELVRTGGVALDEETAGYLEALADRADAVEQRFGMLQAFSRGERGRQARERLVLNEFLRAFYTANRPDMELPGQRFRLRLPPAPLRVDADPEALRVALENLCYNALSFTGPGDVITLELDRRENMARITVRDTGTGIDPKDLPRVWDRGFSRRADGGEGLGLFLVRGIAVSHGGTAEVESRPGQGSAFSLCLPLAE